MERPGRFDEPAMFPFTSQSLFAAARVVVAHLACAVEQSIDEITQVLVSVAPLETTAAGQQLSPRSKRVLRRALSEMPSPS